MINIHVYPSTFTNESRILREACSLREFGYFERVDLVGVGQPGLLAMESIAAGLQVRRFGSRSADRGGVVRKVAGAIDWGFQVYRAYRRDRLACINCHSVAALPLCVLLKRTTGAKLIYDAHELESETNGLGGVRKSATKLVERWLIRYADFSIFVGKSIEEWYVHQYALTRTAVIYNCPRRKTIEASNYFRDCYGIASDRPVFLYLGVLSPGRGIQALIEAFEKLQDTAALVLMGYGPMSEWIETQAKRLPNVFHHDAVPPDRLLAYAAAADYGLSVIEATSLSYEYCMPNKLFEYLMAGKPVLVSPTTEQRDFVTRHEVGVVAADTSPESIRDAVCELLSRDPSNLAESIAMVTSEFNWEKQESNLRRVYETLGFHSRQVAEIQ